MTRPLSDLLRDVTRALACYASTRHAQAHYQKNPAIKAELLEEVAYIEALEREVRAAAQAEAGAGCEECARVTDNLGQINYCVRCGRRFPEHVVEPITLEELIAREGPKWADVPDPTAWVREMRGDIPAAQVMVPRDALEGVLESHTETDGLTGNVTCLSCHVTLMDPRTTGIIWQDHAPDCATVILRAALAQATAEPLGNYGTGEGK